MMLLLILTITVTSISIYIFLEDRKKERDREMMEKIRRRNIEMACELEIMRRNDEVSLGGLAGGLAISLLDNNRKSAVGFKWEE